MRNNIFIHSKVVKQRITFGKWRIQSDNLVKTRNTDNYTSVEYSAAFLQILAMYLSEQINKLYHMGGNRNTLITVANKKSLYHRRTQVKNRISFNLHSITNGLGEIYLM